MQISTQLIVSLWTHERKHFKSQISSENKLGKVYSFHEHIRFTACIKNISESSTYFIKNNILLLYFSKLNFSQIFHLFAKRIVATRKPINSDFETVENYVKYFFSEKRNVINSFKD